MGQKEIQISQDFVPQLMRSFPDVFSSVVQLIVSASAAPGGPQGQRCASDEWEFSFSVYHFTPWQCE